MATISLVTIVKNEEEILENCINSVKGITDEFIIVDTGSTDGTKDIIKKYGKLYEFPFVNFVDTKNEAIKLATSDYILYMDADERIYLGLDKLKEYAEQGVDCISCKITEGPANNDTQVTNLYNRCRMWKNDGRWKFYGPGVHEYISAPDSQIIVDNSILVRHEHIKKNKESTSRERFDKYIELLNTHLEKNPDDPRAWFYLARTKRDLDDSLGAISAYKKYLSLPDNNFKDEKWQGAYDTSLIYRNMGEYDKSFEYANIAISIDNRRAESYNLIGLLNYHLQNFDEAIKWYEIALTKTIPSDVSLFLNPKEYYMVPKDQLTLCYYKTGRFDKAEEACVSLNNNLPEIDTRIQNNIWWCRTKTKMKIFMTLGNTPEGVYGGILEKQGVHGVETTYLEMSSEFAKLGHDVFLFCNINKEHIYDDVNYIPYQNINEYIGLGPDVVITSRWFDALYYENNSKKVIWLQDAHFADPNRPDAFNKADLVICSSPWHRQYIAQRFEHGIKSDKIRVIPLGIRKNIFNQFVPKEKFRVIYSSNPDRGLYILADMWEELTEKIPEIKLDVLYGWQGLMTWGNTPEWKNSIEQQKDKLQEKLGKFNNVNFVGRVTKDMVAKYLLRSVVVLYPNNFWETFCLTALESQAAGTPMITTDMGALGTTLNRNFNLLIADSPYSKEYQKTFISNAVEILKDDGKLMQLSSGNRNYIANLPCDWNDISKRWQQTIWETMK